MCRLLVGRCVKIGELVSLSLGTCFLCCLIKIVVLINSLLGVSSGRHCNGSDKGKLTNKKKNNEILCSLKYQTSNKNRSRTVPAK